MHGRANPSPAVLAEYALADRRLEYDRIAQSLAQMLYCHLLPPDDAYHWTVIVMRMAESVCLRAAHDSEDAKCA